MLRSYGAGVLAEPPPRYSCTIHLQCSTLKNPVFVTHYCPPPLQGEVTATSKEKIAVLSNETLLPPLLAPQKEVLEGSQTQKS